MCLIQGIRPEQEEAVAAIFRKFAGDQDKVEPILQLIGFSFSPAFALNVPQLETLETKGKVQKAVESATGRSFDVATVPLAEVGDWCFNHLHTYLKSDTAYREISYEFMLAYHECAKVLVGTDSVFAIKDWFDLRNTPPKDWRRLDREQGQSFLKNVWGAMTITFHEIMTQAVIYLLHDDESYKDVLPLLNLYKEGIFPFGVGARRVAIASQQPCILALCDKK